MEEEKEITKNRIKEAAEYLFKIIKEPQERRIKIKRGCDTYGLQDWGTHCQNENCEPCNRHMKEFDKLCQEIIQEQLEELKNTEIITLIELKRVLATFDEYDSDGYPVEVWLPSGENLTSPLSHVTQNAQKTVFLDHLANEKL